MTGKWFFRIGVVLTLGGAFALLLTGHPLALAATGLGVCMMIGIPGRR